MVNHEPLFKYWAKELLYALRDITYRSTYDLAEDISLSNVYVSDVGIKLYLKKAHFIGISFGFANLSMFITWAILYYTAA